MFPQTPMMQLRFFNQSNLVLTVSYAELVETQAVGASVSLDHAQLVELLLPRCCSAANVPFLGAHGFVEAFGRAVRAPSASLRCAWYWEGLGLGGCGAVVGGGVLSGWLEMACCLHGDRRCTGRR